MKRVLHVVHEFQTGGAERVILDLTLRSSPGIQNFVCSLCEPHDLVSRLDLTKTGFVCLKKQTGNDFAIVKKIARIIDQEQIDVVHAQGWGTFVESLVAAKLYAKHRSAFIYAFHGKSMQDVAMGIPYRRRIAQRIAHCFTDACIAPAVHMAIEYSSTIALSRNKIDVIYNGVDVSRFCQIDKRNARAALGLGENDFVVGFVGRLNPVKDIQGLVRIYSRIAEIPQRDSRVIRMLIVGGGTEQSAAERLADDLGVTESIMFAGLRNDIPECLAAMDVYLQPSFYEGHSIAILEAMAASLPVVSTRVGGTPEIVCDGETGFLHAPGEYELMAGEIIKFYRRSELCSSMGNAGHKRVTKLYSVETMIDQYESLYHRVSQVAALPCVG